MHQKTENEEMKVRFGLEMKNGQDQPLPMRSELRLNQPQRQRANPKKEGNFRCHRPVSTTILYTM